MFGWLFGQTRTKPAKPKWRIHLDASLRTNPQLALAWTVYAGVKSMFRDGTYAEQYPEAKGKDTPFDEEYFARDALAEYWSVQTPDIQALDPYLHLLAKIRDAGLLREYVWQFLRAEGWLEPEGLALDRLGAWLASDGVAQHQPVTLASVVSG